MVSTALEELFEEGGVQEFVTMMVWGYANH